MVQTIPTAPILLGRHDLTPVREHFMYADDRYDQWVVMAPVTGRIGFTLEPDLGTPVSGQCHVGALIVCPPQVRLHRDLPEPSRTWFAEFNLTGPDLTAWWPSGHVRVSDRARLRADYDLLDEADGLRGPRRRMQQTHALLDVLILIGRENALATRPVDDAAARGAALLEERLGDPELSIGSIAAEVHLSRTQFTRRFSQAYGVPPIRYLTELRIGRARRQLLDTDRSVSAIAKDCGYQSAFYFTRVFRRFADESPSTYRATRRV